MNITKQQLDALKEHLNIGVGDAATDLSEMVQSEINLEVPTIELVGFSNLQEKQNADEGTSSVILPFKGEISGNAGVVFSSGSAIRLIDLLVGDNASNSQELDELKQSTLLEVGNIIINAVLASISDTYNMELEYEPPIYLDKNYLDFLKDEQSKNRFDEDKSVVIFGETFFIVEAEKITGKIHLAFMVDDLDYLIQSWS